MKNARVVLLACFALAIAACEPKAPPQDFASTLIADEFCAGNYDSWKVRLNACAAEKTAGAPGAQCAMLGQVDTLIDQRRRATGFSTCQLVMRWGPNAKKG